MLTMNQYTLCLTHCNEIIKDSGIIDELSGSENVSHFILSMAGSVVVADQVSSGLCDLSIYYNK